MSALFRWSCSISVHLPGLSLVPPISAGHVAFLFICFTGLSLVLPPFSVGHAAFLFICLPCLSLLVSALFRWLCSISIHLSPRLVTGGVRPFPLFLFICLPGLSALFRWPCSISNHLSPRSVTASVHPFPLAMQHFYSSPRSVTAGVRPCPLAMQHFYSCVSQAGGFRPLPLAM